MFSDEHKADADMLAESLEHKAADLETCRRDRTQLTRENSDLRTRLQRAEELLRVAKCPNCDGSGVTVRRETRMEPVCCGNLSDHGDCCNDPIPSPVEDAEPEPCQWCHERDAFLGESHDD